MSVIADFCNCQPTTGLCCESQTDLLSVSVYSMAAALKELGGTDFTSLAALKAEFAASAASLSDTKAAAYAAQLAMCLSKGVGVLPLLTYEEAKAAAKGIQSTFNVRELNMLQGILLWLLLRQCMCEQVQ